MASDPGGGDTMSGGGSGYDGSGYDHGPFNADVWEYWGYIDPYGLPKIQIWQTTFSGGQPGCAISIGGEKWLFFKGSTTAVVLTTLNNLKWAYKFTKVMAH